MASNTVEERDFAEVPRAALYRFAGAPWVEVVASGEANDPDIVMRRSKGFIGDCPKGHAWLREYRDRAFLYFQNW